MADGGTITATCAADFVTKLRVGAVLFQRYGSGYMFNFADRYHDQTGNVIRADSPDNFIEDLIDFGYITVK